MRTITTWRGPTRRKPTTSSDLSRQGKFGDKTAVECHMNPELIPRTDAGTGVDKVVWVLVGVVRILPDLRIEGAFSEEPQWYFQVAGLNRRHASEIPVSTFAAGGH